MRYTITINSNDNTQAVDTFMNGVETLLKQKWGDTRLEREETQ